MAKRYTSDERKEFCSTLHNNKYDYSKADFSNVKIKTIVICPIHGEFEITYDHHYYGKNGCKWCAKEVRDLKSFMGKANEKYNHKYDYSKFVYVNSHKASTIICPIHGEFQKCPNAHLSGQECPKCIMKQPKLENIVETLLNNINISFEKQKQFDWLGKLSLDFYIPQLNIAVECQGKQHFNKGGWSKNFDFQKQLERDERKHLLCEQNNVQVIYYTSEKNINDYFGKIFSDKDDFLRYIKYLLEK